MFRFKFFSAPENENSDFLVKVMSACFTNSSLNVSQAGGIIYQSKAALIQQEPGHSNFQSCLPVKPLKKVKKKELLKAFCWNPNPKREQGDCEPPQNHRTANPELNTQNSSPEVQVPHKFSSICTIFFWPELLSTSNI